MKVKIYFSGEVVYDISLLDTILSGLSVERQSGYGDDAIYLPKEFKPQIEIIRENQIVMEERETIEVLQKKLKEVEKEKSDQWSKAYNAENEKKKLQEEIAILKGVCPHTDEKKEGL